MILINCLTYIDGAFLPCTFLAVYFAQMSSSKVQPVFICQYQSYGNQLAQKQSHKTGIRIRLQLSCVEVQNILQYSFMTLRVCISCSVMSSSSRHHGLQPPRLLCLWKSPGKNTGVSCQSLLHMTLPTLFLKEQSGMSTV